MGDSELLEQIRELIQNSGKSRYVISKQTGISQSQLSKVMAGKAGLSIEAAEVLLDNLGFEIHVKKKRKA
ncbi:MAG: helix-turn-helix transcriptional regulator [Planctomycetaceae bacterium]|nr:helix-turn-helix transcriptional regulator [Planctomycetaceae bacterium]